MLTEQALAVHQSEYPRNTKTYPKVCDVIKSLFDTRTKRETNYRELKRLDFTRLLTEADGSPRRVFNALVAKVEKVSAIAEREDQTEKAKITHLLAAIEKQPWFIPATINVENLTFFSEVVQKVNFSLSKIVLNDSRLDRGREHGKERDRVKTVILYNEDDDNSDEPEFHDD